MNLSVPREASDGTYHYSGGEHTWILPAAPPRSNLDRDLQSITGPIPFSYVDIPDCMRTVHSWESVGPGRPNPQRVPQFLPALEVAETCVKNWTKDIYSRGGEPGIGILPPNESQPTREFLDELRLKQEAYAQGMVAQASDLSQTGKLAQIGNEPRVMAGWLYGTGATKFPWYAKGTFEALIPCLACKRDIRSDALKCEHCETNLVLWCEEMTLDPGNFTEVSAQLHRRKSMAKKV